MPRTTEEGAFDLYKENPSSEHLSGLLSLHQGQAFNLCYQVLHRREDAEDAAQEALFNVVECLSQIESARSFRYRLYRVCLTHALNLKRGNYRRLIHESRFAMNAEPTAPAGEGSQREERTALLDALDRLGDDPRGLIVEHYFERTFLEEIAAREGVSKAAIWQRIDRARQTLKETLTGMGMAALVPDPTPILETCRPVSLSTDLVPGVMAKVTASSAGTAAAVGAEPFTGVLTSGARFLALGGILMTLKQSTTALVALIAATCIALLLIGGLILRGRGVNARADGPEAQTRKAVGDLARPTVPDSNKSVAASPVRKDDGLSPAARDLKSRLEEYCRRLDREFPERFAMNDEGLRGDDERDNYLIRLGQWKSQHLSALRELILSEPATFLEFFRSIKSGDYLDGMLECALLSLKWRRGDDGTGVLTEVSLAEASAIPKALTEGFIELLSSGTSDQRYKVLWFVNTLKNKSPDLTEATRSFMADPDPKFQEVVLDGLLYREAEAPMSEKESEVLRRLTQNSSNVNVACKAVHLMAEKQVPGFQDWLLDTAASTNRHEVAHASLYRLTQEYAENRKEDVAFAERVIDGLGQTLSRWNEPERFKECVKWLMSCFPPERALPALERAADNAPTPEFGRGLKAVAAAIRSGTTDAAQLKSILKRAMK